MLILALVIVSSESKSEVLKPFWLSNTLLFCCEPKEDFCEFQLHGEKASGAYSQELQCRRRIFDDLEPLPPKASCHIYFRLSLNTTGWISIRWDLN